jgi:hypothetical protein
MSFEPRPDRPRLTVQFLIGEVELLVLAVNQVGKANVIRLAAGTVAQQLH